MPVHVSLKVKVFSQCLPWMLYVYMGQKTSEIYFFYEKLSKPFSCLFCFEGTTQFCRWSTELFSHPSVLSPQKSPLAKTPCFQVETEPWYMASFTTYKWNHEFSIIPIIFHHIMTVFVLLYWLAEDQNDSGLF